MPTANPCDTANALGSTAALCESRSLFASRFADPVASDKTTPSRKDWFQSLIGKKSVSHTPWHPPTAKLLHARLQSRLMVNMAGGVMENAGLNLDRYGLPLIPGSAIKGCARRMALQALHDWHAASVEPHSDGVSEDATAPKRPAADDICAPCCKDFTTPAEMLAAIALVFGWVQDDWTTEKNRDKKGNETTWKSDFAWAVAGDESTLSAARQRLPKTDAFAGSIAFLDARPNQDPGLVLDVLTPHHSIYYSPEPDRQKNQRKWEEWKAHRTAPDTEEPVPVFFPAVKEQGENDHFTFPLIPLRSADESLLTFAQEALRVGLEVFGIGAKTNAGYGWFEDITAKLQAEKAKAEELESAKSNTGIADELRAKPKDQLRGILNKFEFDNERYWPQQEPEITAEFQVTLLELHLEDADLLTEAMGVKKAKKALQNLAKKFNRTLP